MRSVTICTTNALAIQSFHAELNFFIAMFIPWFPSEEGDRCLFAKHPAQNRCSVKARASSGPLASQLPALAGGSIPAAAAHCHGWPLMHRALPCPIWGHQVVEALTAGKKTLQLLHLQDHLTSSSAEAKIKIKKIKYSIQVEWWTHVSLTPCGDRLHSWSMDWNGCQGCFR
jgi:hypothetical protein